MKKISLILLSTFLVAGTVEARGFEHHGRRHNRPPERHLFLPNHHPVPRPKEVVIINNSHHHGCNCHETHTTYIYHQTRPSPVASNIYFQNRNFGFGFSNFWW